MKSILFLSFTFFLNQSLYAQIPEVLPKNKLPIDANLIIKKDTTPIRFAVGFRDVIQNASPKEFSIIKRYNLNETDIILGENSITFNKSGLYHFDYFLHASSLSRSMPVITAYIMGMFPASSFMFLKDEGIKASMQEGVYKGNWNFSFEIHITAPVTLKLMRYVIGATSSSVIEGNFMGHFINK